MGAEEDCLDDPLPEAKRARKEDVETLPRFTFMPQDVNEWLAHYNDKGFVILRGVIDKDACDSAQHGLENLVDDLAKSLKDRGLVESDLKELPFESRLWELCRGCLDEMPLLLRPELHKPEFFPLLCHPGVLSAVRQIIKKPEIRIFPNYSARPKTPSEAHTVVWHQDAGLRSDGKPNDAPVEERMEAFNPSVCVNVWSPLVRASAKNGCMKMVPGSHNEGILRHEVYGSYNDMVGVDFSGKHSHSKFGAYATQINNEDMKRLEPFAVDVEMDRGDIVLFSQLMVHRGGTNSTEHIRWSFDWRFQDASKPTCRELKGHVVYSDVAPEKAVTTSQQWGELSLI